MGNRLNKMGIGVTTRKKSSIRNPKVSAKVKWVNSAYRPTLKSAKELEKEQRSWGFKTKIKKTGEKYLVQIKPTKRSKQYMKAIDTRLTHFRKVINKKKR